ncbi:MAG TPA: DUF4097 family beta strand repeat-containing protein [Pyrinomonadaceae bacterium]|nr:DUF4097 family beta strand repeat-containing protein [Pyrinomonadaceae bacterium]
MRRNSYYSLLAAVCLLLLACLYPDGLAAAAPRGNDAGGERGQSPAAVTAEQTLRAEATVTILACVETGDVVVRGWDRKEVRARSTDASRIELRRADATADPNPATRIEVLLARDQAAPARPGLCSNSGNLELDVPRGSTVQIKGNTGDISVADVADARLKTLSGDIELRRITKSIEAWSANGTVVVRNSTGRVRLETIGGEIVASDLKAGEAADECFAKSVSGDITLAKLAHVHVEAYTSNSSIDFTGALASGGRYTLKSHSGNVRLSLPADASFQLSAKVHHGGEIITDFPIRQVPLKASDDPHNPSTVGGPLLGNGRLTGVAGRGDQRDATLILSSFSGTVHLQRQP